MPLSSRKQIFSVVVNRPRHVRPLCWSRNYLAVGLQNHYYVRDQCYAIVRSCVIFLMLIYIALLISYAFQCLMTGFSLKTAVHGKIFFHTCVLNGVDRIIDIGKEQAICSCPTCIKYIHESKMQHY